MKKIIILFVTISFTLMTSCISIKTVVDESAIKEPYKNPLIVILYDKYNTKKFSEKLKTNMELQFRNANIKVEFIFSDLKSSDELTLNQNDDLNTKINNAINNDQKDIVFILKPASISYQNNAKFVNYSLTGIDVVTQKEVWKARFNTSSSFETNGLAKKAAQKILERLKTDKVL
jgi:hypothetical protein